MTFTGHLDRCTVDWIDGWVFDTNEPTRRLRLEFFAGNQHLGGCVADLFRADLAKAGMADGHCAFRFTPALALTEAELKLLKIRINGSDHIFRFGDYEPLLDRTPDPAMVAPRATTTAPPRRFRRCILHIGTEKTGTTSLQFLLGMNRQALRDAGYFTPASLAPHARHELFNHSLIASLAIDPGRFDEDLRGCFEVRDADSLARFRARITAAFEAELAGVPAACDTIILSNEHCHSRLLEPHEVAAAKAFLDRYCDEYKIIVYLRAQHELAASQYGMMLLNGIVDIDMLPPLPYPDDYPKRHYTNVLYFDYAALLERWASVFGASAIHPRLYAREELRNADILDDFIADNALPDTGLRRPEPKNTNVSAAAQSFLIEIHRRLDARDAPGMEPGIAITREFIGNAIRATYPGHGITPTRGAVKAFMAQFQESNDRVRTGWFPHRAELFDIDLARYPSRPASTVLDPDTLYGMFADILLSDKRPTES